MTAGKVLKGAVSLQQVGPVSVGLKALEHWAGWHLVEVGSFHVGKQWKGGAGYQ